MSSERPHLGETFRLFVEHETAKEESQTLSEKRDEAYTRMFARLNEAGILTVAGITIYNAIHAIAVLAEYAGCCPKWLRHPYYDPVNDSQKAANNAMKKLTGIETSIRQRGLKP